ncbi:hypothetical protein ERHA54_50420 (plasmid) [Erwinia rhapontici]|nr:hypothetical protein ERHA54_50420 [Erwinia rhapontici]
MPDEFLITCIIKYAHVLTQNIVLCLIYSPFNDEISSFFIHQTRSIINYRTFFIRGTDIDLCITKRLKETSFMTPPFGSKLLYIVIQRRL